ncbi:MAG: hypothetical protein DRI48_04705 [Chloroflexi bacterium]|nr:MAG: hypothetical protein DRI48_04705 [Chloroflexota bacterium]
MEDRKPASERLAPALNGQVEYDVVAVRTRRDALARVHEVHPVVIVLDSPSMRFSCRRFCDTLRDDGFDIPVLMLLAQGEKIDPHLGTRAHLAHLHYPFSIKKLNSRIVRLLPVPEDDVLAVGDVVLNIKQQSVVRKGRETHLTPKQARLLEVFLRHPGEILTRSYLMKQVWNTDYMGDTRTLDVHIHWVRKAIETDHTAPVYLRTIRGVGYRFEVPEED